MPSPARFARTNLCDGLLDILRYAEHYAMSSIIQDPRMVLVIGREFSDSREHTVVMGSG